MKKRALLVAVGGLAAVSLWRIRPVTPRDAPPPSSLVWNEEALERFYAFSHGISRLHLDNAERLCNRSSFCHRASFVRGRLYIRDVRAIFFDRTYAMARVLPLLLVLRHHGSTIPDFEAIFHGGDYPIASIDKPPSVLFSPTTSQRHRDVPWPDFSFFPPIGRCATCQHPLRTPRWGTVRAEIARAATRPFSERLPLGAFTGNMMGPLRRRLFELARTQNESHLFVNEIFIKSNPPSCFDIRVDAPRRGGVLQNRCGVKFSDMARYKYLINVGSNGYANKCKYLFLTGAVVVWVRRGSEHREFFERQLLPGVHYVAVDDVDDVPGAIAWLKAHEESARSIASAGRRRMEQLDDEAIADYGATMLREYARKQRFVPAPLDVEVLCEDDIVRHYDRDGHLVGRYLTEDNASCIGPLRKVTSPGWGGAYNGSKVPCAKAHDLVAEPDGCPSKVDPS